jgi:hypothetical protein
MELNGRLEAWALDAPGDASKETKARQKRGVDARIELSFVIDPRATV